MATTTENLGMTLPDATDPVDVTVLNGNFSAIDTFAGQQTAKETEQDDRLTAIETSVGDIYGLGAPIPSGTDWDTLTDVGVYYVASSSAMGTMSNAPTTGAGGRLEIRAANAAAHRIQIFYAASATNPRFYMRLYLLQSGTMVWTPWYLYAGTVVS